MSCFISSRLQGIVLLYHISTIVATSRSLQCIFAAHIYYFRTIPLQSDKAHPFRKSPSLTLWKSSQIELSQQFPAPLSWQNVFIAVRRSCLWSAAPSEHLTGECAGARKHTYCTGMQTAVRSRGPIMGYCDREWLKGSQPPPTGHSTLDKLPAHPVTVIGVLWYIGMGAKGSVDTLKLFWRIWSSVCSADKIIRSSLCCLAHFVFIFFKKIGLFSPNILIYFAKVRVASCLYETSWTSPRSQQPSIKKLTFDKVLQEWHSNMRRTKWPLPFLILVSFILFVSWADSIEAFRITVRDGTRSACLCQQCSRTLWMSYSTLSLFLVFRQMQTK